MTQLTTLTLTPQQLRVLRSQLTQSVSVAQLTSPRFQGSVLQQVLTLVQGQ